MMVICLQQTRNQQQLYCCYIEKVVRENNRLLSFLAMSANYIFFSSSFASMQFIRRQWHGREFFYNKRLFVVNQLLKLATC